MFSALPRKKITHLREKPPNETLCLFNFWFLPYQLLTKCRVHEEKSNFYMYVHITIAGLGQPSGDLSKARSLEAKLETEPYSYRLSTIVKVLSYFQIPDDNLTTFVCLYFSNVISNYGVNKQTRTNYYSGWLFRRHTI